MTGTIKAEYGRINVWHVVATIVGMLIATATNAYLFGGTIAEIRSSISAVSSDVNDLQDRGKEADARFKLLFDKTPQFDVIAQQILRLTEISGELRKANDATNDRLDRQQTVQADKLDKLIDAVADLRGDMKSVKSQLGDNSVRPRVPTTLRIR
jgi:hypothetical protein